MGFKKGFSKFSRGFLNVLTCNSTKRFGKRSANTAANSADTTTNTVSEKSLGISSPATSSSSSAPSSSSDPSSSSAPFSGSTPSTENVSIVNETPTNNTNANQTARNFTISIASEGLQARYGSLITNLEQALNQILRTPESHSSTTTETSIFEALFDVTAQAILSLNSSNNGSTNTVQNQNTATEQVPVQETTMELVSVQETTAEQVSETMSEKAPEQELVSVQETMSEKAPVQETNPFIINSKELERPLLG